MSDHLRGCKCPRCHDQESLLRPVDAPMPVSFTECDDLRDKLSAALAEAARMRGELATAESVCVEMADMAYGRLPDRWTAKLRAKMRERIRAARAEEAVELTGLRARLAEVERERDGYALDVEAMLKQIAEHDALHNVQARESSQLRLERDSARRLCVKLAYGRDWHKKMHREEWGDAVDLIQEWSNGGGK